LRPIIANPTCSTVSNASTTSTTAAEPTTASRIGAAHDTANAAAFTTSSALLTMAISSF
jgi:hypothetical protein